MAPHTGFIAAAFLVAGVSLVGTIVAVFFDYRIQIQALARLARNHAKSSDRP